MNPGDEPPELDAQVALLQTHMQGVMKVLDKMLVGMNQPGARNAAGAYPAFLSDLTSFLISVNKLSVELANTNAAHFAIMPLLNSDPASAEQALRLSLPLSFFSFHITQTHTLLPVNDETEGARRLSVAASTLTLPRIEAEDMRLQAQFVDDTDGKGEYPAAALEAHNAAVKSALDTLKKEEHTGARPPRVLQPPVPRAGCTVEPGPNKALEQVVRLMLGPPLGLKEIAAPAPARSARRTAAGQQAAHQQSMQHLQAQQQQQQQLHHLQQQHQHQQQQQRQAQRYAMPQGAQQTQQYQQYQRMM